MSIDDRAWATIDGCLISIVRGPCPIGCISPNRGWSYVVASALNGASKLSISCYTICECTNHLEVQYHISNVCW